MSADMCLLLYVIKLVRAALHYGTECSAEGVNIILFRVCLQMCIVVPISAMRLNKLEAR